MERLNRAENGQIDDDRYKEIQEDYVKTIAPFLEKYKDIDHADLLLICSSTFNYQLTKSKLKEYVKYKENI